MKFEVRALIRGEVDYKSIFEVEGDKVMMPEAYAFALTNVKHYIGDVVDWYVQPVTEPSNVSICHCCGQNRPFPTERGEWEFCEMPTSPKAHWVRCTIQNPLPDDRDGPDGLRLWVNDEMMWWPKNAAWRKI